MKYKKNFDPFENLTLDEEEQAIEDAIERGEYVEDPNFTDTKKMLEEAAKNFIKMQKSKPITLRVNQMDLIKVKAKAKKKNIPYQTLLNSLIHQFADSEYDSTDIYIQQGPAPTYTVRDKSAYGEENASKSTEK